MTALYLPAEARCRQIERLVRLNPGATMHELAGLTRLHANVVRGYVQRLAREARVVVRSESMPRGGRYKLVYPPDTGPMPTQKAT